MRRIISVLVISCLATFSCSASPIPADLVGIWATENSKFRGEELWSGNAIYLDADGSGAGVGGDGTDVLGVQLSVTSYNAKTNTLNVDLIDNEKVVSSEAIIYDPVKKTLSFAKDPTKIYGRRADRVSSHMMKSLGLAVRK